MAPNDIKETHIRADAGDPGFRFVLQEGLVRGAGGHLGTIVGRGGSGKSILALQIVTRLLKEAHEAERLKGVDPARLSAAFYFTLEASPEELARQVDQFDWGFDQYGEDWKKEKTGNDRYANGLHLVSVPSPVESLRALGMKIRQTIAAKLQQIGNLAAIIIDPMGAVNPAEDLEANLTQLKELADTHSTFVFLLTEQHVFKKNKAIEHYSQSIIHLEHDPGHRQHRRLHVQKARGQSFRSGYHHFELHQPSRERSEGIRVLPAIDAQSADAHYHLKRAQERQSVENQSESPEAKQRQTFLMPSKLVIPEKNQLITPGSAIFLMGPPGTFKEKLADHFATAALQDDGGATVYLSFKTDIKEGEQKGFDARSRLEGEPREWKTYFYDARSPLLTPEEVLFTIRRAIEFDTKGSHFKRAIVWGLRRLYDFPNFREGAVQFLEALVTMLKARQITTFLVDWPDKQTATTVLPIVDLCQYIFLTRVCYRMQEKDEIKNEVVRQHLSKLWAPDHQGDIPRQIALLRIQRTPDGVHHDRGLVYKQFPNQVNRWTMVDAAEDYERFEDLWTHYGRKWEDDLSLQS
jgi:KaiC/GvpD/RAD55 family RecA-like ATPase